ncbi:MAG TPA: GIY-YIG nuclease family protein [Nevskiaceae bacterium]|nr:GIY-YIG nuclease family protein [Nevskiaceae bacterium]
MKSGARGARRPSWFVYMIECEGNRIYTGVAVDVDARYKKHCAGRGAAFTRINKPVRLLAAKKCRSRSDALKLEYKLKQLKRTAKAGWIERWRA